MLVQSWAAPAVSPKDAAVPRAPAWALSPPSLQGNLIGHSGARMIADAIRTNAPDCVVDV